MTSLRGFEKTVKVSVLGCLRQIGSLLVFEDAPRLTHMAFCKRIELHPGEFGKRDPLPVGENQ
jgi:hypothetical protein